MRGVGTARRTTRGPQDAERVDSRPGLVVGADDIEVARADAVEHVQHRLLGRPRARRLLLAGLGAAERGERPAGDEEVRGHVLAALAQLVREALGERLDRGLGRVVRGVATGRGSEKEEGWGVREA
jgi:hypothetical protein